MEAGREGRREGLLGLRPSLPRGQGQGALERFGEGAGQRPTELACARDSAEENSAEEGLGGRLWVGAEALGYTDFRGELISS